MANENDTVTRFDMLISIIFLFFCTFMCTLITLPLIRQICKYKKTMIFDTISSILIISCILTSTLCVWCDLSRHIICYIQNTDLYVYPINNIMGAADLFNYIGIILFYLIAISGVHLSFYGTDFAIHRCVLCFLYGLISLVFILSIYYVIIVCINPDDPKHWTPSTNNFWYKYDRIPMITIGIIDFLLNASLLILFITKLNQLIATRLSNCDIHKLRDKNCEIFRFSHNLLTLMTRHTVLFTFAIFTNQIWYITVLIQDNFGMDLYFTVFCFRAIGNTSNCIILFLSFKDNLWCYLSICKCCHQNIQKCFISNILYTIKSDKSINHRALLSNNYRLIEDTSIQESNAVTTSAQNSNISHWKP